VTPHGVGEAEFRRALRRFATGVTVVTCVHDGMDHAMTANAVSSLSLRPPLVMVAVERTTRFWEAVKDERYWGMSILDETARDHAAWLATSGRPLAGQLARIPLHRGVRGMALLDQSLAWLECRSYQRFPAGDHDVFIGEVERATLGPDADPLLYWSAGYRHLGGPA
jgi:flavin reductase (DIM6/NTAB) family NADH-FMN oxidoreductase RutF